MNRHLIPLLLLTLLTGVSPSVSNAGEEQTADTVNLHKELAPPPKIEGAEVKSHIRREDGAVITEYSIKGAIYMIRVQPAGDFPAYYLYDNDGDGEFEQRLPGGYKHISPPMWVIKKF